MNEQLIDLDELVIRCKDEATKEYIKEAVLCYKAGAFRSCIVSTWNAVVFDYLYKLYQLELAGDGAAKTDLKQFEDDSSSKSYPNLLTFENQIPENAQAKYEFISIIEKEDLERLKHDRNRCAHPSIISIEEPFQPTPELARYHLRNAVTHLLQYPPVHGRVAINRIWSMIRSAGFPEDYEEAIIVLKDSYLGRARKTFIKDVIIGLTKGLLLEDIKETKERNCMYAALQAISHLHFEQFRTALSNKLPSIIDSVDNDKKWSEVFKYLHVMKVWDLVNEGQRIKAKNLIKNIKILDEGKNAYIFFFALESIDEIQACALEQLKNFKGFNLTRLMEIIKKDRSKIENKAVKQVIQLYKDYVVEGFINSGSFAAASSYGTELILVASWLNNEEIKGILKACHENNQVLDGFKVPEVMENLFQENIKTAQLLKNEWLLIREKIENFPPYANLLQLINDNCSDG